MAPSFVKTFAHKQDFRHKNGISFLIHSTLLKVVAPQKFSGTPLTKVSGELKKLDGFYTFNLFLRACENE